MLTIILFSVIAALIVISTKLIMTKLSELQPQLDAVNATLQKVQTEVSTQAANLQARIAELEGLINNSSDPELPAAAEASLTALKDSAAALDALNPDTTDTTPTEPTPTP